MREPSQAAEEGQATRSPSRTRGKVDKEGAGPEDERRTPAQHSPQHSTEKAKYF